MSFILQNMIIKKQEQRKDKDMIIVTKREEKYTTGQRISPTDGDIIASTDHECAARAVAKAAGFEGTLYPVEYEYASIVIWGPEYRRSGTRITITPVPLLTWEPGALWVGECGGTRYEVRKAGNYVVFCVDGNAKARYVGLDGLKEEVKNFVPNLTWSPGPVCVARIGERTIEIYPVDSTLFIWRSMHNDGGGLSRGVSPVSSLDECKADAERWARENQGNTA